jgi:hypothetical protein
MMVGEGDRLEVRECLSGQGEELILEEAAVGLGFCGVAFLDKDAGSSIDAQFGSAVGVGGIQEERLGREFVGGLETDGEVLAKRPGHADKVEGDDEEAMAAGVF